MTMVNIYRKAQGISDWLAHRLFDENLQILMSIKDSVSGSYPAKEIIDFIDNTPKRISVLVADVEGFDAAFGPFIDRFAVYGPVAAWNPFMYMRTAAYNGVKATKQFSGAMTVEGIGRRQIVVYPPHILLLHELGHAKQWLETDGSWFATKDNGIVKFGDKTTEEIEADNLARHENPVCKAAGLPVRRKYMDFNFTDSEGNKGGCFKQRN